VHIDVIHDTACPWCRIGKANLRKALETWAGDEPVTIQFWAYQLNPTLPPEGSTFAEVMATKYRGIPLESMFDGPRRAGAQAGLVFNFDKLTRAPNTVLSHRLIVIAPPDRREHVIDAIYDAYFQHGQDIARLDVLLDCAEQAGIDRAWAQAQLEGEAGLAQVLEEARVVAEAGVSGVPFFIFDQKLSLSGAQPPEVFRRALDKALELRQTSQD
jgi:predicted DsbA family dithiol-disulfide isomerase